MLLALIVLTVTTLMIAAAFVAANGDIGNTQHDVDGKRAYYAARAGLANFLYKLNKNTELWQTCPTQAAIKVPGGPSTTKYSYAPVPSNGASTCNTASPVGTMIDFATGHLPDEVHRDRRRRQRGDEGDADDRRQLPSRLAARLPLVLRLRDARPQHLRRPGEQAGLRGLPARRAPVGLRGDQLDHRRHAQRSDVHPGPVLDLRRADLRQTGRDRQRAHDGSGPADGPRDDPYLRLSEPGRPQRGSDRERAVHQRAT